MADQKEIDAKAIRGHKAVGSDNKGGQDKIDPQRIKDGEKKFKGIKMHDPDKNTWGV